MERSLTILDDDNVDTADVARYEASRRDLLRRGIAWGGATLAVSSIPSLLFVRDAFAEEEDEAGILKAAIGLEEVAVFAYTKAGHTGLLSSSWVAARRPPRPSASVTPNCSHRSQRPGTKRRSPAMRSSSRPPPSVPTTTLISSCKAPGFSRRAPRSWPTKAST